MFIVMSLVAIALVIIVFLVAFSAINDAFELEPKEKHSKIKNKLRQAAIENQKLRAELLEKDQRIELLDTELTAYRHQLPWVNIEELDGSQEQENSR